MTTETEREKMMRWLSEAREAYHNLNTGQQEATLTHDNKSVTYSQTSTMKLQAYITELEVKLGIRKSRSRASGFIY